MTNATNNTILVIGSTGKTGMCVADPNSSRSAASPSALGREPKDIADYARETASSGVRTPVHEEAPSGQETPRDFTDFAPDDARAGLRR